MPTPFALGQALPALDSSRQLRAYSDELKQTQVGGPRLFVDVTEHDLDGDGRADTREIKKRRVYASGDEFVEPSVHRQLLDVEGRVIASASTGKNGLVTQESHWDLASDPSKHSELTVSVDDDGDGKADSVTVYAGDPRLGVVRPYGAAETIYAKIASKSWQRTS